MTVDKTGITFHSELLTKQGYWIAWDRIRDERDVLGWVSHLSEKDWITKRMLAAFIEHCARKLDFAYRPLP